MSWVAVAIGGSALIGAAGSAIAGNQAAKATEGATNAAINEQKSALASQQALSAPYQQIGTTGGAIQQYENLLGLGPQGGQGIQATLAATPGYQFAKQQGIQGTVNQASAMGLGLSGNTLEGLDKFSTGLADQTYQQAVGNAQGAVGIGQAAAAGQAANIGQAAGNISGALINQGNNIAGIDANIGAGIAKAAGGGATNYLAYNTLQGLNNPSGVGAPLGASSQPGMLTSGGYTINDPSVGSGYGY